MDDDFQQDGLVGDDPDTFEDEGLEEEEEKY